MKEIFIDSFLVVKRGVYMPELGTLGKPCSVCNITKPLSEYHRNKTRSDGRNPICKSCYSEYSKKYTRENAHRISQRQSEWYILNRERERGKRRQHYQENKETYKARARQYARDHVEERSEYEKRRYQTREDKQKRWASHSAARKHGAVGEWSLLQWKTLRELAEHKCMCCGKEETAMDHIIPLSLGGENWITNIQVLCKSCNSSKGNHHATDYRPEHIKEWAQKEMENLE